MIFSRDGQKVKAAEKLAMVLNQPVMKTTVQTVYKGFTLDVIEESMGTQKLIKLICPIMDIFQKGKTFICDEIECHLHPLIVRQLVGRFIKGRVKDDNVQKKYLESKYCRVAKDVWE